MRSLRASRAKIFPAPEEATAFTAHAAACSSTSSPPFATWDAGSCFWRTSERSLFGGWMPFSDRWPRAGSLRSGRVYRRPKLALRTSESGGSVSPWPTPRGHEVGGYQNQTDGSRLMTLTGAADNWPTIKATDEAKGGPNQRDSSGAPSLEMAAGNWSTPSASDESRMTGKSLAQHTAIWTTPQSHDVKKRSRGQTSGRLNNKAGNACLATDAEVWPTPAARDYKSGQASDETFGSNARPLNEVACRFSLRDQREIGAESQNGSGQRSVLRWIVANLKPRSGELSDWLSLAETVGSDEGTLDALLSVLPRRRRLNPAFVNWLMGTPSPLWTRPEPINFGAPEMASWCSRQLRRMQHFLAD